MSILHERNTNCNGSVHPTEETALVGTVWRHEKGDVGIITEYDDEFAFITLAADFAAPGAPYYKIAKTPLAAFNGSERFWMEFTGDLKAK